MRVENKILLHISRKTDWEIGDILIAGENENPFWSKCKDFSPMLEVNGKKIRCSKYLNDMKVLMSQKII